MNKILMVYFIITSVNLYSQTVNKYLGTSESLITKMEWASNENKIQGFWVGYSIKVKMKETPYYYDVKLDPFSEKRYSMFESIISGISKVKISQNEVWQIEAEKIQNNKANKVYKLENDDTIEREIGVMIHFYGNSVNFSEVDEVFAARLNKWIKIDNSPILWLGLIDQNQSADFLINKFNENEKYLLKVNFMELVGVHKNYKDILTFLDSILTYNESNKIVKSAIYWVGQQDNLKALDILKLKLAKMESKELKSNIISSISQMTISEAENFIFSLINTSVDVEIKKNAIYWIGRKSTNASCDVLRNLSFSDPNPSIQREAVFAISEIENSCGIPLLTEIAKTHLNSDIRLFAISRLAFKAELFLEKQILESNVSKEDTELKKQALIALSQMCNDDNIDELVNVAKGHPNPIIRKEAIRLLGKKEDKRALEAIENVVKNIN